VNQQTGRYNSFITQFAAGFQDTTLQMYRWLLYPVLTVNTPDLQRGLRYRALRDSLRAKHPEGESLNLGNLTQALQATASLTRLLNDVNTVEAVRDHRVAKARRELGVKEGFTCADYFPELVGFPAIRVDSNNPTR
jgi:hypothetical protein